MPRKTKSSKEAKEAKDAPKVEPVSKGLFDDSSSEDDQEDGGVTINGAKGQDLKINEEYAARFEHNKKREELHKLEEKYGKGGKAGESDESSSDEDEDDDGFLVTDQLDAEISATLAAIKNKDPRIYDKEAVFYKPVDPEDVPQKEKTEKPVTLRDYHRERYMAGDVGADEEEVEEVQPTTYVQDQDDLRKGILAEINAAAEEDEEWSDDDAFIKKAAKPESKLNKDGMHPSRVAPVKITESDVATADKNPEEFLDKFMASKAWAPPKGSKWEAFGSEDEEDSSDDIADQFENAYNMRFEDPTKANEFLKTYSRNAAAARSVRKEELKGRKKLRALEKEKKEADEKKRSEERARLRRLKIDEASGKLAKIKKAAGLTGKSLQEEDLAKLLEDAFDDDKWEAHMKKQFGDDYYAEADDFFPASADEEEEGSDEGESKKDKSKKKKAAKPEKPVWDDDIDINDIIPDFEEKPKVTLDDEDAEPEAEVEAAQDSDDDDERPSKKRKTTKDIKNDRIAAKRQAKAELAKIEALVNTKMEIDNPSLLSKPTKGHKSVGGFRYRETSPNVFGMTAADILLAPSDAALNEFAGLKKLAPFRDAEKKRKDKKRLGKKARLREWRRETFGREYERTGPTFGFDGGEIETAAAGPASGSNADAVVNGDVAMGGVVVEKSVEVGSGVVDGERKKRKRSKKSKKKIGAVTAEDFADGDEE